jgi:putative superfamily III holin-X
MAPNPNLGDFVTENKKIMKDYLDIRLEILRLQVVKMFSKAAGYLLWTIISLFLMLLFFIFLFLTMGLWFSQLTDSYIIGFAITTVIILVTVVVITLLRRMLFVNPIVRNTIKQMEKNGTDNNKKI